MIARPIRLEIVVPVYQGERFLERLVLEIEQLIDSLRRRRLPVELHRARFVDDSAVDGSALLLDRLAATRPWLEVLHLPQNAGQHSATMAGFAQSDADWIATLDEDLQHRPPVVLELLTRAVETSADLVYAAPASAVHRTFYRDLASRAAKCGISVLAGLPEVRRVNSFRLVRGEVARAASRLYQPGDYLDIALFWCSRRVATVAVAQTDLREAEGGSSGYDFRALWRHARRMIRSARQGPRAARSAAPFGTTGARSSRSPAPADWRSGASPTRQQFDRSRDEELRDLLLAPPGSTGSPQTDAC